jgi:peptidyl-prolyl cis-trans isomerase SurA
MMAKINIFLIIIFFTLFNRIEALENKIILKIDSDIITTFDIFEEMNSLKFFNNKLHQVNDEEIYQISLDSLVKNKIKKNEIIKRTNKIKLEDDAYINTLIKNKYENLGFKDLKSFIKELENRNINYEKYLQKLKIDILWNQLIYSLYFDKVIINENELEEKIRNQSDLITSYNLSEIIFQVMKIDDLKNVYEVIKKDINERGFENAALKHSISETGSNGGSLGWINENQINKEILLLLNEISKKSITEPIRIPSGFLILKKNDVKKTEKNLDKKKELKKLINYETQIQLSNYSNIHFNKVKKNININAP